ncbi:MAG: hypothetical protein GWP08_07730 [Nitrospiraceae bacterium]|nr:hypothetical protein [Nitrospiraceae bacterium]
MQTTIRTQSPLRMLYCWAIRGHRVTCIVRRPYLMVLGFILYRTTYVLTASV